MSVVFVLPLEEATSGFWIVRAAPESLALIGPGLRDGQMKCFELAIASDNVILSVVPPAWCLRQYQHEATQATNH